MAVHRAASIVDLLFGLALAPADPQSGNRCSLEGLSSVARDDGTLEVRIRRATADALRVSSGPFTLDIEHLAVHEIEALVRAEAGRPRLLGLTAAGAECSGLKIQAPLLRSAPAAPTATEAPGFWELGPLAGADGVVRAKIVDAHLLFDADVTVPIRHGEVHFNDAAVEHVGPDSRMGVSRLGLYVDAPNGRSYLYQFPAAPVDGVDYERRGAMLGPWVTERGKLRLQAFAESMLRQAAGSRAAGVTAQARLLLDRTAISGDVQLGDGRLAAPGVQAELAGRADGRNAVRLHSEAVGRGLTVEMASLLLRNATAGWRGTRVGCDELTAAFALHLLVGDSQVRVAFELAGMRVSALRLHGTASAPPPEPGFTSR